MNRIRARVVEMLDAIGHIEAFVQPGREEFLSSDLIQSAVLYKLGSLGESAKGVPSPFRERNVAIPWKQITGLRDIVNHKYYSIDLQEVWTTVERDLPPLKGQLLNLLENDSELAE